MTTEPTPTGETTLDPFHPLGRVKRLRHRPVRTFLGAGGDEYGTDQFLALLQVGRGARQLGQLVLQLRYCHHTFLS